MSNIPSPAFSASNKMTLKKRRFESSWTRMLLWFCPFSDIRDNGSVKALLVPGECARNFKKQHANAPALYAMDCFCTLPSSHVITAGNLAGSLLRAQASPEEYDQTALKLARARNQAAFPRAGFAYHRSSGPCFTGPRFTAPCSFEPCSSAPLHNSRPALAGGISNSDSQYQAREWPIAP